MNQLRNTMSGPSQKIETVDELPRAAVYSGGGFIASYLCQKLLELPLQVAFVTPREVDEVKHLLPNPRFRQYVGAPDVSSSGAHSEFDYVFELTSAQSEGDERRAPEHYHALSKDAPGKVLQVINLHSADPARLFEKPEKGSADGNANLTRAFILHPYGPKMPVGGWALPLMLRSVKRLGKLSIEGEGLSTLYPVFAPDVATALVKAMFSDGTKGKTLLIGGKHEVTAINLAYKLREVMLHDTDEIVDIIFSDSQEERTSLTEKAVLREKLQESREQLGWEPTTDLEEGLHKTLKWMLHSRKKTQRESIKQGSTDKAPRASEEGQANQSRAGAAPSLETTENKVSLAHASRVGHGRKRRKWLVAVMVLVALTLTPLAIFMFSVASAIANFGQAADLVFNSETESAAAYSQKSERRFSRAKQQVTVLSRVIPQSSIQHQTIILAGYLRVGELLSQALTHAARASEEGKNIQAIVVSHSQGDINESVLKATSELRAIHTNLAHAETILSQNRGKPGFLPAAIASAMISGSEKLPTLRGLISQLDSFLRLAPALVGVESKRTYLVVIQNNTELRPTGGFIGSYGLVTFEKGKLLDWKVEDVYAADGQLKGHVDPPSEIREYLGEAGWYLRDSNWDPDFPTSARQIEWFFEKETGIDVDGTIAVNLYVVKELLAALGAQHIPDYNEMVTAENLFETAQFHSEMNFFPGSTQKKDFLGSLGKNMFLSIEQANPAMLVKLGHALANSLNRGQLLIAVDDAKVQQSLHDLGWDGSLKEAQCKAGRDGCTKTFLALSEANVGVNKANYYLKRRIQIAQHIDGERLNTGLRVVLQNTSPANVWPGGDYRNYMRIYTNPQSLIRKVAVDGEELEADELSIKAEHGKQVVGFLVNVPPRKERTIELTLQSEEMAVRNGQAETSLLVQKQPGTQDDPIEIVVTSPSNMRVVGASPPMQLSETKATLEAAFEKDLSLQFEFEGREVVE